MKIVMKNSGRKKRIKIWEGRDQRENWLKNYERKSRLKNRQET